MPGSAKWVTKQIKSLEPEKSPGPMRSRGFKFVKVTRED